MIILFAVFVLLAVNVSGEISVSPENLGIPLQATEGACREIEVYSQGFNGALVVSNFWSVIPSKNKIDYNLSAKDVGIIIKYSDYIDPFSDDVSEEVCVYPNVAGTYYGVLIYQPFYNSEPYGASANVWLTIDVSKLQSVDNSQSSGDSASRDYGGSGTVGLTIQENNSSDGENAGGNYELLAAKTDVAEQEADSTAGGKENAFDRLDLLSPLRLIPILVIIGLIVSSVLVKKKRKKMSTMGKA